MVQKFRAGQMSLKSFGKIQMKNLIFHISRDGKNLEITVTPIEKTVEGEKIGLIGVYSPVEKSPVQAINYWIYRNLFLDKANFCHAWKIGYWSIFN